MAKVKKCKYCREEIDSKAKVCPYCQKKQSSKKAPIIIGVIAIILVGSGIGAGGNKVQKTGDISSNSETSNVQAENETNFAGIGQYVESEDWKISLLNAKTYSEIPDKEGFYSDTPEEGKTYLVLFLEAENISESDDYFNSLYFEAYEDGYSVDSSMLFNNPEGYSSCSGDVAKGKKIKGYVAYEVNADWKEFEFYYKNGVWTSGKAAAFKIESSQIS